MARETRKGFCDLTCRLLLVTVALAVLAGCSRVSGGRTPLTTASVVTPVPVSGVFVAAASPTPTLAWGRKDFVFIPMVVEGRPLVPTPTATRSATPYPQRSMSEAMVIASAVSSQRAGEAGLALEVEGEVQNRGEVPVQSVRVVVRALGQEGLCGSGAVTLLGKAEAVLEPEERWPFSGTVYLNCQAEEVALTVAGLETEANPLRLTVEEAQVGVSEDGDWLLLGSLSNPLPFVVGYPRVVVVVRDARDEYLASTVAYADVVSLEVGGSVAFRAVIPKERVAGWAHFEAIGTGERY